MAASTYCPSCGAEATPGARFCSTCGASFSRRDDFVPPPPPFVQDPYRGYAPYSSPMPVAAGTNGFAIASLITGLLCIPVLALIFGYVAKSQIRASGYQQQGSGMATAGIVLGWVSLALVVLFIFFAVVGSVATSP